MAKKRRKPKSKVRLSDRQKNFLIPIFLFALSLGIRSFNLLSFPLFSDEALLLGWSKKVASDLANNLTLSIRADGYPPLSTWLQAISFKFFSNPVFAGRFISVLAGALSTLGVYFIGKKIYSREVGILASLLYIFIPFTFFIDRYAYHDSLMTFFGVYILLFSLLLLKGEKKYQPLYFLGLGLSMAVGVLSKTAAFLMLTFPLLSWLFLKENCSTEKLKPIIAAYIFPALSYWWLFSDPYSWLIMKKGRDLSLSFSQLLTLPFSQWEKNLILTATNWYHYLTLPLIFLFITGFSILISEKDRRDWLLVSCSLLPTVFFILVSQGRIHFKYLAFTIPPLAVALAKFATKLSEALSIYLKNSNIPVFKSKNIESIKLYSINLLFALLIIPSLHFDYYLISNPLKAKLEPVDYEIHIEGLFSGTELSKAADFLKKQAQSQIILVVLPHPDIAILYSGLPLLCDSTPNLYFIQFGGNIFYHKNGEKQCINFGKQLKPQLTGEEKILAVQPDDASNEWPELFLRGNPEAKLIKKFVKPGQKSSINIYEIPY